MDDNDDIRYVRYEYNKAHTGTYNEYILCPECNRDLYVAVNDTIYKVFKKRKKRKKAKK